MNIRLALAKDIEKIIKYDKHIKKSILVNSIANNYVYIVEENQFQSFITITHIFLTQAKTSHFNKCSSFLNISIYI